MAEILVLGPPPPRVDSRPEAHLDPIFQLFYRKYGRCRRLTPLQFAQTGGLALARNKMLADFFVVIRFNRRNLRFRVDPNDTVWFGRLRKDIATLLAKMTENNTVMDERLIRLEDARAEPSRLPITDTSESLTALRQLATFGIRLVILTQPEGRIAPLHGRPVYKYNRQESPSFLPGSLDSENNRNVVINETTVAANELKETAAAVLMPIANRIISARHPNAPNGVLETHKMVLEEMWKPNGANVAPMAPTGSLRASLEAANCPYVADAANDIALQLAKKICRMIPTAHSVGNQPSIIENQAKIACACVFDRLWSNACSWGRRRPPRHCCPAPPAVLASNSDLSALKAAVPVKEVCAPLGDKVVKRIQERLVAASYLDPYTDHIDAVGHVRSGVVDTTQNLSVNYSGYESGEEVSFAAVEAANKRSCYARKNFLGTEVKAPETYGLLDDKRFAVHVPTRSTLLASPMAAPELASNRDASNMRVSLLGGRPEMFIRVRATPPEATKLLLMENAIKVSALPLADKVATGIVLGDAKAVTAGLKQAKCKCCGSGIGKVVALGANIPAGVPTDLPLYRCELCPTKPAKDDAEEGSAAAAAANAPAADEPAAADSGSDSDEDTKAQQPQQAPPEAPAQTPGGDDAPIADDAPQKQPDQPEQPAAPSEVVDETPQPASEPEAPMAPAASPAAFVNPPAVPPSPVAPMPSAQMAPPATSKPAPVLARTAMPPLPPMPAVGMAAVRVGNQSTRDITVSLVQGSSSAVSVTVPSGGVAEVPSFPAGQYRIIVVSGGQSVFADRVARRFAQRLLYGITYQSNNTIVFTLAHAYLLERTRIARFWDRLFRRQPGTKYGGDSGIYLLPSASVQGGLDHVFINSKDIQKDMSNTIKVQEDFFGGDEKTFLRFDSHATANSIGKNLSFTRDENNLQIEIKRPDGSTSWAPILATVNVSSEVADHAHGSTVLIVDAPLDHVVAAAVRQ